MVVQHAFTEKQRKFKLHVKSATSVHLYNDINVQNISLYTC